MSGALLLQAAKAMGLTAHEVGLISLTAPNRYKTYTVPKRSGGLRTIAQPAREVKDLQYFLMERLLSTLPVHDAAKAYRSSLSIRHNALVHSRNAAILKMDFIDFFGSVKAEHFRQLCRENSIVLDDSDLSFCQNVLFWHQHPREALKLSIGAPSSPMLSNAVVFGFDEIMDGICRRAEVAYSRYADDLTFSSDNVDALVAIRAEVPRVLKDLRYPILYVNWDKTTIITKKHRRTVTGLVITNDGHVSLGRDKKRELRATVHAFLLGNLSDSETELLRGHLAFCKSVEPEYFSRLERKYGIESLQRIMKRRFAQRRSVEG